MISKLNLKFCCIAISLSLSLSLSTSSFKQKLQTTCNQDDFSVVFLDRHHVGERCPSNTALNGWNLEPCNRGAYLDPINGGIDGIKIQYYCTALPSGSSGTETDRSTGCQDIGDAQYFDRHQLDCADSEVLSEWQMHKCTDTTYRVDYKCKAANIDNNHCEIKETQCDEVQGKELVWLDRHDVICETNQYLHGFGQTRAECEDGKHQFRYTCCPSV